MIKYVSFGSGSSGNCTLIEMGNTRIIVDVGISFRRMKMELQKLNLSIKDIDAFLITHEHSDHINAISYIPQDKIYASELTLVGFGEINEICKFKKFNINDVEILPLPISHDCINGVCYMITYNNEKLVYMTDTGYVNRKLYDYISNATYYVIESNHDPVMLEKSGRPQSLIMRILSDKGHLSNEQCGYFLADVIGPNTKAIMLAHLSEVANTKDLALHDVLKILDEYKIDYSKIYIVAADRKETTFGLKEYEEN